MAGLGAQIASVHPPVLHRSLTQARISFAIEEAGAPFSDPAPRESRVNPLPGLNPESSDLVILAERSGWTYAQLIENILQAALERHAMKPMTFAHS